MKKEHLKEIDKLRDKFCNDNKILCRDSITDVITDVYDSLGVVFVSFIGFNFKEELVNSEVFELK